MQGTKHAFSATARLTKENGFNFFRQTLDECKLIHNHAENSNETKD